MTETIKIAGMNDSTIPSVCEKIDAHTRTAVYHPGDMFANYRLRALITCTANSEVWYGEDIGGFHCTVKITSEVPDMEAFQRIREIDCENLVPVLDCGIENNTWYEVYPYYKYGALNEIVTVELLKNTILPGIINALEALHQEGIAHNDIKPNNLFWDDQMEKVLLGDFGNALPIKKKPGSLTVSYAAPELLLNDVCRRASDWGAVGLTIASLLNGKPLIETDSPQKAIRLWEQGVRFFYDDFSVQQLVNGMLVTDPRRRMGPKAAKQWCGNISLGGEIRTTQKTDREQSILTISFKNPSHVAADIESLLQGIETHWEYSVFLFQQAKLDRFLSQFDKEWVTVCRKYRGMANGEDALYRLTLELTDADSFVWRGKRYFSLLEMEETWERDSIGEMDICTFLQRGNAGYYLRKRDNAIEKVEFVKRLQDMSKVHPYEACAQLFQALRGNDGLNWYDTVLNDLGDVVDWLKTKEDNLDSAIDSIFNSKKFEAWFAYQGMEDVLEDIRRKSGL